MFADGIREYTQPIVHGLTREQVDTRSSMKLEFEDWHRIEGYFFYIQKRFRAHYDVINYIRTHKVDPQEYYDKYEQICLLNPLFKQKEATSLEAGILALKRFKQEAKYTGTGLAFKHANKIADSIIKALSLPYIKEDGVHLDATAIYVAAKMLRINASGKEEQASLGHAVSFLKVMGTWTYYDDNRGFIQVDEKVIEVLKDGNLRIVIYGGVHFVKARKDDTYESIWSKGEWNKEHIKILYEGDKVIQGIYLYEPRDMFSIKHVEQELLNDSHRACKITAKELEPKTTDELNATLSKFKTNIYANLETNSQIFENMYHFLYDSIDLVKKDPEVLEFVEKTTKTVVLRPACSPLTHYWCSKINMALKGIKPDSLKWFKIPKLRREAHKRVHHRTPPEFIQKIKEAREKEAESKSPKFTPCLPGQVRDKKTLKCRDREPRKARSHGSIKSNTKKNKPPKEPKERCPKGEIRDPTTGECVPRPSPCPPGKVRDKDTGLCRGRLEKNQCPEGQIFDKKTKKCRDQKAFKF